MFTSHVARLVFAFVIAAAIASPAQTFTTLLNFDGTNGSSVGSPLVQASDGDFYGTSYFGGANNYGSIFKMTARGALTTIYNFNNTDGASPTGQLIQASNGSFYGSTTYGGANGYAYGSIFKITPAGTLTTLHSFAETDGENPCSNMVLATDGNLYGVTRAGGPTGYCSNGCGTVFKISQAGTLTTLYMFQGSGGVDGVYPCGLIQASNGDFYGATNYGGANNFGTVFKITPTGVLTTLHSFNIADGLYPSSDLMQASNGNIYGTTQEGGDLSCNSPYGCGVIFKVSSAGTVTTAYSFTTTAYPDTRLVQATDGNFYGTTFEDGTNNYGTIFKLTPTFTLTTLHSFVGTDGGIPGGDLIQATNGTFYGTTRAAGSLGDGTVFSLSTGLGPFVTLVSSSGKESAKIGVLGQGFSSASVVKFGGTQATTVATSGTTYLTATVPAGALTGSVTVTTGSTTLTSSQQFKVKPTFTSFNPPSGTVGTSVTITGTGLEQTTKVTFNGKSAAITVNSDTQVTATVPTGATTGKIAVFTKGGSVSSTTSFTVN